MALVPPLSVSLICDRLSESLVSRLPARFEGGGEFADALVKHRGDAADGGIEFFLEEPCAKIEIHHRIISARLERLIEGRTLFVQRGIERGEGLLETCGDRLLAGKQAVGDFTGAGDKGFVELAGALAESCVELFGVGVER